MTAEVHIIIPECAVIRDGHLVVTVESGETVRLGASHFQFKPGKITQVKNRELECTVKGVRLI